MQQVVILHEVMCELSFVQHITPRKLPVKTITCRTVFLCKFDIIILTISFIGADKGSIDNYWKEPG